VRCGRAHEAQSGELYLNLAKCIPPRRREEALEVLDAGLKYARKISG